MEYPKIETVFDRDPETHKVVVRQLRKPEFGLVSEWLVTEKIDGTNIRVHVGLEGGGSRRVTAKGRTDNAQIPPFLVERLQQMFPPRVFDAVFDDDVNEVILFGEGYGARIQKGGGDYRDGVSFRLFDVVVRGERDWWLAWEDVEDVARKLGIQTVPVVGYGHTTDEALSLVKDGLLSLVADAEAPGNTSRQAEGIVARTEPALFDRRGARLMWKLKERDF